MAADRMSLAVPIMALSFQIFFGDDDDNLKRQLTLRKLPNKTHLIGHVFTPYQLVPSPQDSSYQVMWSQIFYSSYTKHSEDRTILHDPKPVGTVM